MIHPENRSLVMNQVYKSKKGLGILIPVGSLLGSALLMAVYWRSWPVALFLGLVLLFIIHLFSTTCYTVEDEFLKIRSGLLYKQTLPIAAIRKIESTRNPLSAPALSLDRLEIWYGRWDSVLVSPRDQRAFAHHLKALNPDIELKLKP